MHFLFIAGGGVFSLVGVFLGYRALAAADFLQAPKTASLAATFGPWPVRIFYAALGAFVCMLGLGMAALGAYLQWFR